MSTNMVRNNPPIMAAMQKNILEHISLMAQEQVELEFADMLQQAQQLNQQKLDQNEELAELRADTSLEKQEIANDARFALEGMKPNR